jgi:hypothetical protein
MRPVAFVLLMLLIPTTALAQETRTFRNFQPMKARKADPVWCWAASMQMCLNSAGTRAAQKDILVQAHLLEAELPPLEDLPIRFTWKQGRAGRFDVTTRYLPTPLKRVQILDAFADNRMIVAEVGDDNPWQIPPHLVVIYGYRIDLMNQMHLKIYDPASPGQERPEVDYSEPWDWRRTLLLHAEPADSVNRSSFNKDPLYCLKLLNSDVQWGPYVTGGTLYYALTYENICDQPVRCAVTIQSGNRADGIALAGTAKWFLSQSRTQTFVLMPGASYTVRGGLRWRRLEKTTPQILFPGPDRNQNLNLIRCDYLMKVER